MSLQPVNRELSTEDWDRVWRSSCLTALRVWVNLYSSAGELGGGHSFIDLQNTLCCCWLLSPDFDDIIGHS